MYWRLFDTLVLFFAGVAFGVILSLWWRCAQIRQLAADSAFDVPPVSLGERPPE